MRKHILTVAVLLTLAAFPTLALAGWNPTAMSSYPSCQALSCQMTSCSNVVTTSLVSLCNQSATLPIVVPLETANCSLESPCSISCAPPELSFFNATVPVSIQNVNGCPTICTPMDMKLANLVVMVPAACGDKQIMVPALAKPMGHHTMTFAPLDTEACASGSASLPLQINGCTVMAPLNWPGCVQTASFCLPCSQVLEIQTQ